MECLICYSVVSYEQHVRFYKKLSTLRCNNTGKSLRARNYSRHVVIGCRCKTTAWFCFDVTRMAIECVVSTPEGRRGRAQPPDSPRPCDPRDPFYKVTCFNRLVEHTDLKSRAVCVCVRVCVSHLYFFE